MTYAVLVAVAVILLLVAALGITIKISAARGRKIAALEESLKSARQELEQQGEYQKKREEAQENADAKKDLLHTGDAAVNFDNSIKLLHGAGGKGS